VNVPGVRTATGEPGETGEAGHRLQIAAGTGVGGESEQSRWVRGLTGLDRPRGDQGWVETPTSTGAVQPVDQLAQEAHASVCSEPAPCHLTVQRVGQPQLDPAIISGLAHQVRAF